MSYSYSTPLTYGPANNLYVNEPEPQKKKSSVPYAIGGVVVGGAGAAYVSHTISPYVKPNGEAKDSFARKALDVWIEKSSDVVKKSHKQGGEILKKIDEVKTVEGLKTLLEGNAVAAKEVCGEQTLEEFLKTVTDNNLSNNKKTIKETLSASKRTREQNMKNWIEASWDKSKKAFQKVETVTEEAYNAITESAKGMKWKKNLKWGVIGAVGVGIVGYVAHKLCANSKNNVPKQ